MSNYKGSNLAQVIPEQRVKTYPDITNEQVQAWWNAFSSGAGSDESIGAKYDEGKTSTSLLTTAPPSVPRRRGRT